MAVLSGLAAPAMAATLRIEPTVGLELRAGPHTVADLERQRYFRTYHIPGMYGEERAAELAALGVSPGRGTGPYLSSPGGDSRRAAWSAAADDQFRNYAELFRKAARRYPDTPFAMAGGNYPSPGDSTSRSDGETVDATMATNQRKGIHPDDFDACIGLIGRWLGTIRDAGTPLPRWFSPLNEPDAAWKESPNPPQDHADFARQMALRLKTEFPDVKLSGPCTAWSHPDGAWRRWTESGWEKRFIDTAGDVAGAYDFHFYSKEYWAYSEESPGFAAERKQPAPNLYATLKNGNPFVWDFGKAEAYLDLVYAYHQTLWSRPSLPVIISEFGRQGITPQLGPWSDEYLYYLYGTTVTRLWAGFMNRPEVVLTVPFILPESDWGYGPQRGQALYTRPGAPADMTLRPTPLLRFYEFFKDFGGTRLDFQWQDLDQETALGLFAVPVRRGNDVQVLLHNSFNHPLELKLATGKTPVANPCLARMRWQGEAPGDYRAPAAGHWRIDREAGEPCDLSSLTLAPEETVIVKFTCQAPIQTQTVGERFYARQTLLPLAGPDALFSLELPDLGTAQAAELVASVTAPTGFAPGTYLTVIVNNQPIEPVDLGFTKGMSAIMVPIRISLPAQSLVKGQNRVAIRLTNPASGAAVGSVRLDTRTPAILH